jgi:hypothetical protein
MALRSEHVHECIVTLMNKGASGKENPIGSSPANSGKGPLIRSPIGIGAAASGRGKSTQHDDAANLVTQACSGHPLRRLQMPDMAAFGSTVELRLNASSDYAATKVSKRGGHRFRTMISRRIGFRMANERN